MSNTRPSSLAVKYRPRSFATLTGQKHVSGVLRRAVETSQVPQQLLFSGSSGLGKTTVARICAAAVLCEAPLSERDHGDACLKCESCLDVTELERSHPDVIEFDAASNGGKDDIKDIAARASLAPLRGSSKIYIIDEAHGLSGPGGQAFLKLLEEPPSHVIFMLATTDPQKMLRTNRSRCVTFELLRPSDAELVKNLQRVATAEGWNLDVASAEAVIAATDPSLGIRGTLMTLEKLSGILSTNETLTPENLSEVLGVPDAQRVQALTLALESSDAQAGFGALEILRQNSSDQSIRAALLKWAKTELINATSKDRNSLEVARWRHRVLVETPIGEAWTDSIVARLTAGHMDPSAESLSAQLAEAQAALSELKKLLREGKPGPLSLSPAPERALSESSKSHPHPAAEPSQKNVHEGFKPPRRESESSQTKAEAVTPPAPVRSARPRTQLTQTNGPDAPKAPPRAERTPPAKGDTAARTLDGATRMLLGALGQSNPDATTLVKASKVRIEKEYLILAVPPKHHQDANRLVGELRDASRRLNLKIKFESL